MPDSPNDQYAAIFAALQSSYDLNASSAAELMTSFIDGVRTNMAESKRLMKAQDLDQLKKTAHAFKSLCLSYHAKTCASLCEELETAVKSGDWQEIENRLQLLNKDVQTLLKDFDQHAGSSAQTSSTT